MASGALSLAVKLPVAASYLRRRWIVEAKPPVVSERRCAARPVGGGEVDADFLGFEDVDEGAQNCRLPGSRSAGEDGEFVGERVLEGSALEVGEGEAGFFLGPLDGGVGFDRRESAGGAGEAGDDGGDFFFGAVVVGQLDEAGSRKLSVEC